MLKSVFQNWPKVDLDPIEEDNHNPSILQSDILGQSMIVGFMKRIEAELKDAKVNQKEVISRLDKLDAIEKNVENLSERISNIELLESKNASDIKRVCEELKTTQVEDEHIKNKVSDKQLNCYVKESNHLHCI